VQVEISLPTNTTVDLMACFNYEAQQIKNS
jgi:hypothetical protein